MIGLIFGHSGDPLGKKVEKLYVDVRTEIDAAKMLPNRALFEQFINDHLLAIRKEMKPIWENFVRFAATPSPE